MIASAPITGGWLAGLILLGVICFFAVAFIITSLLTWKEDGAKTVFATTMVVTIITLAAWLWGSWPLSYNYHHWITKQGRVEQKVGSRFIAQDHGTTQKFVVVLNGHAYGVNDTRASLLRRGDFVRLRCKKAYEFGTPRHSQGWDCKWVDGPQ